MRSSGLLAIPDGIRSPRASKDIQKIILAVHQVLTKEYGVRLVPLSFFVSLVNEATAARGMTTLTMPSYHQYLEVISNRVSRGTQAFEVIGDTLVLEPAAMEWDDFDLQPIVMLVESKNPIRPDGFKERLAEAEQRLNEYSKLVHSLRFTSPLLGRAEIFDAVARIVNTARSRLYLMIAFFGEELKFFPEFLGTAAKVSELDLRILIRNPESDAKGNQELVAGIKRNFGERDVIRVYSSEFYLRTGGHPGRLHSKMMVSEAFLLVGSANMTNYSLGSNEESALFTNQPDLVQQASDHFCAVWNQFRPLGGDSR